MTERDLRVSALAHRLFTMGLPAWTPDICHEMAEKILATGEESEARQERLSFILATRRDLEELPVLGDAA